jgi:glycosyltransferase involved in cell wall biosynthesis
MARLLVFTSHPIQYQVPWFRHIAERHTLQVVFSALPDAAEQAQGFGGRFAWDIDLKSGYDWSVAPSWRLPDRVPEFLRRPVHGLGALIRAFRPDAALVMGWHQVSLLQAQWAVRGAGVPLLLRSEAHNLVPRRPAVRRLHHWILDGSAAVLSIGERNRAYYRDYGYPESRIYAAPYFVDNRRFAAEAARLQPERAALRARWGIPADALCLLFAGKLEPKKRPLDLLNALGDAAAAGARVHGLIVGSGELSAAAEALATERQLPVTFAGFLNQSQIPEAYAAADALVLPSDYGETWGLVVNEGMISGLPAIVSERVGCAHDLVRDGETGAVVPFADVTALATQIGDWARDRVQVARLAQRAGQHVQAYSIDTATAALDAALLAVGGQTRPRLA